MSVDTTVVIAACRRFGVNSELEYTAAVIQAAENLFHEEPQVALQKARMCFLEQVCPWFSTLGRAKQFAHLLAQEEREQGTLEYEDRPIIEIGEDGVYTLSRRGRRH